MTRHLKDAAIGLALAAGTFLAASTAQANLVSIGFAEDTTAIPLASFSGDGTATTPSPAGANFGDYNIKASGTGTPPLPQPEFLTGTIDIQQSGSGTHTLYVYITEQGLTSPTGVVPFGSGFTSNFQSASAVNLETLIDTHNGLFTGTVLDQASFGAAPLSTQTASSLDNSPNLTGPFSETAVYKVTTTSGRSANLTISLNSMAVPEPASLAVFGTGLVGFALLRRRRKKI